MRAVVERVAFARVKVGDKTVSETEKGVMALVGIAADDADADVKYIADKIVNLRIFEDEAGKMNFSVRDIAGQVMLVSQFTLMGDARKGRRPDFFAAAPPDNALKIFDTLAEAVRDMGIDVNTGCFGEHMLVEHLNDGPVTILLDSKKRF